MHCARHFSSRLPPSGGTCKYARAPSTKKTLIDSLPIDMLLSAVSVLVVAQSSSEVPEGLMNNPVYRGENTSVSVHTHSFNGLPYDRSVVSSQASSAQMRSSASSFNLLYPLLSLR